MAQPIPIFTSPSTTIVQVDSNTIQNPYTPVILNAVQYPGQLVTVLNMLSSLNILTSPIVVSTVSATSFTDGTFSTLIQQPQGYVTTQSLLPNQWAYLNSYPFRDQYLSAGVQHLTTSTLYTALQSTLVDVTSSLTVENLVVSGNFYQSSGLILNTSVSSLGAVYLLSSLTVTGATTFESSVSSLGYTQFGDSLSIGQNLQAQSSIRFESTLAISTSLSVQGYINLSSSRSVFLEGGLIGTSLEIQSSTPVAMNVAGSLLAEVTFSTLSSMRVGGPLSLRDMVIYGSLSSLSSMATTNTLVDTTSLFKKDLTVSGKLGLGGSLRVGDTLSVLNNLVGDSSLSVYSEIQTLSTFTSGSLDAVGAYIQGNLTIVSTSAVSAQGLTIKGSLGFQTLSSISTSIGGSVSTLSSLVLANGTFIEGYTTATGTISSLSSFSVSQDLYGLGSMSIGGILALTGDLILQGNVDLLENFLVNIQGYTSSISSVISGDLSVIQSLSVTDTAIISSIVLPSSVLAFNLITSTMTAGYQGIADKVQISTLATSSLTTGALSNADATMDMANVLQTLNLSTCFLDASLLQLGASSQPSTFVQTTSSFGTYTTASTNTIDINTIGYTLNTTYVDKTLSSLQVFGSNVKGTFVGDGFLLSNINYPAAVSTLFLSSGSLLVEKTFLSTTYASSGYVLDGFLPYSTLTVGAFTLYGNAVQDIQNTSNTLLTIKGSPNVVVLNNMYIYGDSASLYPKQVVVNSNVLPSLSNLYSFGVGGVLRLNDIVSPEFSLYIDTFYGDVVVGVDIGTSQTNTLYVSSGSIGQRTTPFFIPEGASYLSLSTNTIQPLLSTLIFNSTLSIDREKAAVGINTTPFYTLDVASEVYVQQATLVSQSTFIQNQLNIEQQRSSFWLGVTSNDGTSNILYSADEGETWTNFTPTNLREGGTLLNVATNGGELAITSSNTLIGVKRWVATSVPSAQYYDEGSPSWSNVTNTSKFPQSNAGLAYNGQLWVLAGYNSSDYSPTTFPPLHWSTDGITWEKAVSGGFTWNSVSQSYGGHGVAWNGSLWVTVGEGATPNNSILYSGDGKNWSNARTGGFSYGGYGIAWCGSNWVASGNNGGPLSSFCVSADGSNWTAIGGYGFNGIYEQRGNSVATDGSLVVAVGTYNTGWPATSIQYSRDSGYTWCNASGTLFGGNGDEGLSVVWNGNYWLAGGSTGIRKSLDGINWTQPPLSPTTRLFHGLAYSSNAQPVLQIGESNYVSSFTSTITTFNVACGADGSNCLRYSFDGMSWSNAESGYFTTIARGAAWNGSLWVAVGSGTASNFVYSQDGKNWSNGNILAAISLFAIGTSVAYGAGYWITTMDPQGFGDTLFYSSNGSDWYPASAGTQFSVVGNGVAYGNGKYTAVGDDGISLRTILYAQTLTPPDTWSSAGITNSFDTKGYGIVYGNSLWVAVGEDTTGFSIKSSSDQQAWVDGTGVFGTAGYGIDYNGSNLWVAVGNGAATYGALTSNILYSGDGTNWSNVTSGDFVSIGYGVRYNQGLSLWIATGYDTPSMGTVKYSGDGLNWSNGAGGFDQIGYGVGVSSNIVVSQQTYVNQLRIYNTPGAAVTLRDTTPNISYTSTSIQFMDTLTIDRFKNVSIHPSPNGYVSTFYENNVAAVSTFVSSQRIQVAGYFLGTSLV